MRRIFHYFAEFGRLAAVSCKYWRLYRSATENGKVFLLRLAATGPGRRLLSRKEVHVTLRSMPQPVYVRRATSDILVLHEIFELGGYGLAREWQLPPSPVILDLGGNIGLATLYFASIFPAATVIVAEPEPANLRILELNCRHLIADQRVKVAGAFVGASDGVAGIDRGGESWEFRKVDLAKAAAEPIECLSVPSLLRRSGAARIDLVKCDIEGSEAELFGSCRDWITQVRFLIVETHRPYTLEALYGDLRQAGWEFKVWKDWEGEEIGQCFLERREGGKS
jgi:FkbM family methyltransferase